MNFFENGTYLKNSYFTINSPFKYLCYPQISGGGKFSPVSWVPAHFSFVELPGITVWGKIQFLLFFSLELSWPKSWSQNLTTTQHKIVSSQTSFSFREERDPFSIIPLFSVSLIEFEISFPTRESFSLQKLFPLFLSQRKNQVLPPILWWKAREK